VQKGELKKHASPHSYWLLRLPFGDKKDGASQGEKRRVRTHRKVPRSREETKIARIGLLCKEKENNREDREDATGSHVRRMPVRSWVVKKQTPCQSLAWGKKKGKMGRERYPFRGERTESRPSAIFRALSAPLK